MMKFPRRRLLHLAAGAAALPALSPFTWAQAYPAKPITMIVPFAAGGGTDLVGRSRLAELGQEIPPREQQTPEALRALQKAEIEKWWPIIKSANIKGE
jgi:tripartite-type tricarboxylate transporter receptor subunit TctC